MATFQRTSGLAGCGRRRRTFHAFRVIMGHHLGMLCQRDCVVKRSAEQADWGNAHGGAVGSASLGWRAYLHGWGELLPGF